MVLGARDVMGEPRATRRDLLTRQVMPLVADPVREAPRFDAALADLIAVVRAQGDWTVALIIPGGKRERVPRFIVDLR